MDRTWKQDICQILVWIVGMIAAIVFFGSCIILDEMNRLHDYVLRIEYYEKVFRLPAEWVILTLLIGIGLGLVTFWLAEKVSVDASQISH